MLRIRQPVRTISHEGPGADLRDPARLNGCGLILVNPPWVLESELAILLPALAGLLGHDGKGGFALDWLAGEGPVAAR